MRSKTITEFASGPPELLETSGRASFAVGRPRDNLTDCESTQDGSRGPFYRPPDAPDDAADEPRTFFNAVTIAWSRRFFATTFPSGPTRKTLGMPET